MDNNINYIAFDFVEENNNEISPENVEVEITALDQYKIAEYKFDNTLYDLVPEFNEGFTYTYEDVVNGTTTTRTIYSDNLPTLIRFGYRTGGWEELPSHGTEASAASLLEVLYVNTDNLIDTKDMFRVCTRLKKVKGLQIKENITSMGCMFDNCQSLSSIENLSEWKVNNVTSMGYLFYNCDNLTGELDLSNWETDSLINLNYTFSESTGLTTIDLSNWDVNNVTTMENMFYECNNLTSITMKYSDYNSVNKIITELPARTTDSMGTLDIEGVDDHRLVNKSEAELRHWAIMTIFPNIKYYTLANEAEGIFAYPIINSDESALSNSSMSLEAIENEGSDETILCIEIETQEDINSIQFVNPEYLLKMLILDTSNMTTMKDLFKNCTQLNSIECSDWDTSNVTDMQGMFYNCNNLTSLDLSNFDTSNVTSMNNMIRGCHSLTSLDVSNFNTSNVTSMSNMFNYCQSLTSLDVSNFNTSKVTNMSTMFYGCHSLTSLDVSNFDTNNVTIMNDMFNYCKSLTSLDLSNFNTSKVTNMSNMFANCESLTSLVLGNGFNMDNVTNIAYIFSGCNNLILLIVPNATVSMKLDDHLPTRTADSPGTLIVTGDKYNLDTNTPASKYWNIDGKFLVAEYKFNNSIDTLFSEVNEGFVYTYTDVDNGDGTITRTIYSDQLPTIIRFEDCEGLLEVDYLNTSELTTLRKSFKNCYNVTSINATNWNTSKVTSLYEAFEDCNNLTTLGDVSNWDTSNVTDMFGIFDNCHNLIALDVSNWDTSNVVDMNGVFRDCYLLESIGSLSNWDTSKVTDMDGMFNDCRLLTQLDLSNFDTSKVTTMYQMFCDCYSLTSVDLSNFDTANVINMSAMFNDCQSLTSLDVSNFDTSKVTNMSEMFFACKSLTTLDLSNFDTSKVTDMQWMFGFYETGNEAMALTSIAGLGNWDTTNVTNMCCMFCNCRNLTSLDVSDWKTSNVTDMNNMFYACRALTSIDLSNFDTSNVTDMSEMINECHALTELNISNWHLNSEVNVTDMFKDTNVLANVIMHNSDYNSINKIITQLPTRTTDSPGTLNMAGIDDISQVDTTTAQSKFWAINNPEKIKSIKINNKNINKIYKGLLKIKKVYLG